MQIYYKFLAYHVYNIMNLEDTLQLLRTLKEVGLSANEANVYLTLLTLGPNPVSTVAKKANLNRSSCYTILDRLMQKGFVHQSNKQNVTYFSSVDPKLMLNQLTSKKHDLEDRIENLRRSMGQFEKIRCDYSQKPTVLFYEGEAAIQNIMEDTLNAKEVVRAYASLQELTNLLPNYFPGYYKRRTQKGIFIKAIYPANQLSYKHKLRDHKENRESRLIPPEFNFHLDILIYDNKVAITSLNDKFGLLIKSQSMANAQKKIFDIIWEGTKTYDDVMTTMMEQKYGNPQKPRLKKKKSTSV